VLKKGNDALPTVKVLWNSMPDLDEDSTISNQELQPTKWKKKSKFRWQMDIDVELFENYHGGENRDVINYDVNNDNKNEDDSDSGDSDGSDDEESVLGYGTDSFIESNMSSDSNSD
jgi:hypothetical protein